MRIKSLVTGGAGFIGSHVADSLIELGHTVVILDDLSGGSKENLPKQAIFKKGSILDNELIEDLFKTYQFDYVYHLAAYAAEGLSPFIRRFNYQNNLIGSVNLINAAVNYKVKCFVFTSSIAVYGDNPLPHHEDQVPQPVDPYGIAKYSVELDLKNAAEQFGLNYIVFRPHNVYGSRQNIGDKYRNVIGIFMNKILQDKPLVVFGDGEQSRAFTHISDVAPIIANAINNQDAINQVFDIGANETYTVNEMAKEVMSVLGKNVAIQFEPARNEMMHAYANHTKYKKTFQITSTTPLREGLIEMVEYVKSVGAQKSTLFKGIEIEENLPQSWKNNH